MGLDRGFFIDAKIKKMMKKIRNPFTPSHPTVPDNLKGRENQILEIDKSLSEAKRGGINHFLLIGDRGIGKTSLLHYANRSAQSWSDNFSENFNYIVVNIKLERTTKQKDLAKEIYEKIQNQLKKNNSTLTKHIEKTWSFMQRIEVGGSKISPSAENFSNTTNIINEISEALIEITQNHCTEESFDGILILIDEADQASEELAIGAFIKYITENLELQHCSQVIFGLSGLPSIINKLTSSHASSLRIFNIMEIPKLNRVDFVEIIDDIKISLSSTYNVEFQIAENAQDFWWSISDGHPHHLQQIGYQTFKAACLDHEGTGNILNIHNSHLMKALYENNGIADVIGSMYCNSGLQLFLENRTTVKIFRAICGTEKYNYSIEDIENDIHEFTVQEIKNSLVKLKNSEMIHIDTGNQKLSIKYPLYAHWFSKTFPETISS